MKPRTLVRLTIGIFAMMASSGCSDRGTDAITIDDHVFDVPREYLIEERIPWLPQSEEKGLLFNINPGAPVRERISVLVESRRITCRQSDASEQLARECAGKSDKIDAEPINWESVKKIESDGDTTQWSYVHEEAGTTPITVASCFAMADGDDGLCTVLGSYSDLVYSLGIRDSEVARIPQIKRTVSKLLSEWDNQTQA